MKAMQLVPAMEEGGVERYVVQLNRFLTGAGWQNAVVSSGGALDGELASDGAKTVTLNLASKNPFSLPFRALALRRRIREEMPDVICAHSRVPAWICHFATAGMRVPWITYAHGANSISRYSRIMTCGDIVMCPSTFVRDYLHSAYATPLSKFRVVPHAVDASRFDPDRLDGNFMTARREEWNLTGRRVVMSIGRITRLKGFDTLLRAFSLMHARDASLVIVGGAKCGKQGLLEELRGLANSLGVADRVVFAGAQSRTAECLALADVVVSANTSKPESFGLSMAEALTMGKPVVAKAFGGALEVVRNGLDGVLVKTGTPREFADAIDSVLSAASTFDAMTIRQSATDRFSIERMRASTLAVYDEMLRLGNGGPAGT